MATVPARGKPPTAKSSKAATKKALAPKGKAGPPKPSRPQQAQRGLQGATRRPPTPGLPPPAPTPPVPPPSQPLGVPGLGMGHMSNANNPKGVGAGANWIAGAIKKPGALHEDLGVPQGQKIPAKKVNAAAKGGGKTAQRARLAKTLKGFNK